MTHEWLEDPYVKKWLSGIEPSTAKGYVKRFVRWLAFIKMTPTQQIEKRVKDLQSNDTRTRSFFEDKLVEYKNMLETKDYTKNTIVGYMIPIQSFFSRNRLGLRFARKELTVKSKNKVLHKWLPSNEEIRAMYSMADVRDRALLLVLYQSGFSEADVEALNIQDLIDRRTNKTVYDIGEQHLVIFKKREKSDVTQKTCISLEACHDIRLMLLERGKPSEGALFTTPRGNRLTTRFMNDAIKSLAQKALGEQSKHFQTKVLRDCYGDTLLRANLVQQVKDSLFGHKPASARANYEISPQTVYESYQKAFKYLSVNGGLQTRKDLESIKQDMQLLKTYYGTSQIVITGLSQCLLILLEAIDLNSLTQEQRQQITDFVSQLKKAT